MFFTITGILTRIISNSYLNVFQKLLTSKSAKSSVINFFTYSGLTAAGFFCIILHTNSIIPNQELITNFLIMGLLGALGNYFIIKALSVGELSSLAPINSYKPVVGIIAGFLYLKEIPEPAALIGIFLIIFGTYFLSKTTENTSKKAIFYRILALILSGSEAVFIKKIILLTNVPASFFLWALSGLVFSSVFLLGTKNKIKIPPIKEQLLLILSVGIMQFSTNFVFARMNVSYALALFQLSTLFSVFLGVNIFHEKNFTKKILASIIMLIGAIIIILN